MDDKMIKGVITNMDTGEEAEMEHYALFPDYGLTSIVLVKGIECHGTDPDDCKEIAVNCKALDCIGMVYDLNMTFTAETSEEKTALLLDMETNSVHLVCSRDAFTITNPLFCMTLNIDQLNRIIRKMRSGRHSASTKSINVVTERWTADDPFPKNEDEYVRIGFF